MLAIILVILEQVTQYVNFCYSCKNFGSELCRLQCDLITCFKIIHGFNCLVVNKLHVVIHLNCMCSTAELMLESIFLVRV